MTEARREDYWQSVGKTALDLLLDAADDWTIHAATVAGADEDEETVFLAVVRSRLGDAGLLLSLRYARVAVLDRDVAWTDNGIEMRVNGPLHEALLRSFARVGNEGLAGEQEEPLALSVLTEDGNVEDDPEVLTTPLDRLRDDGDEEAPEGRDPRLKESREGDTSATVECQECGGQVPREDAINIGGGIGVDVWACEGTHVEQGGEDA
jgi:hypothetical protein